MLMRNLQLPEAAFTYQRPGTCLRARHCKRRMGYTAGNACTQGTLPSRWRGPLLRSPFSGFKRRTQNPAQRLQKGLSGRQPPSKRKGEPHLHRGGLMAEKHVSWQVPCSPAFVMRRNNRASADVLRPERFGTINSEEVTQRSRLERRPRLRAGFSGPVWDKASSPRREKTPQTPEQSLGLYLLRAFPVCRNYDNGIICPLPKANSQ